MFVLSYCGDSRGQGSQFLCFSTSGGALAWTPVSLLVAFQRLPALTLHDELRGSVGLPRPKGEAACSSLCSYAEGRSWLHELVREEHSCLTSGLHCGSEGPCSEAASAGYGLDASKAETRIKAPLCGPGWIPSSAFAADRLRASRRKPWSSVSPDPLRLADV